jgi:hypothetical protein
MPSRQLRADGWASAELGMGMHTEFFSPFLHHFNLGFLIKNTAIPTSGIKDELHAPVGSSV